jgi:membrane protease YdiL (CAAX protease family)
MLTRMFIAIQLWLRRVKDLLMDSSEVDRWGTVASSVVFIIVAGAALQFLMVFVGSGVWWLLLGGRTPPPFDASEAGSPEVMEFLILMGPLASVLAYAPILLAVPFIRSKLNANPMLKIPKMNGLESGMWKRRIIKTLICIAISIGLIAVMQVIGWVFHALGDDSASSSSTITFTGLIVDLVEGRAIWPVWTVITIIIVTVIAPLLEEVVFRGLILNELMNSTLAYGYDRNGSRRRTLAREVMMIITSGLLFSLIHIPGAGASTALVVTSMTVLGSVLALLDWKWFHSIWPGTLVHVSYNVITLMISVGLALV